MRRTSKPISQVLQPCLLLLATILAALLCSLDVAHAEQNPQNAIGAETEAFRNQTKVNPQVAPASPPIEAPEEDEPAAPEENEKSFFVKTIQLEGAKSIPLKDLRPLIEKFENQNLTLTQLRAIAKSITERYRLQGFVTSRAIVPPQKLDEQAIVIKILEGKLGKTTFAGNKYFKSDWLSEFITVKPNEILQFDELQRGVTRLNRNPDRKVKAVMLPGDQPETTDVLFNVTDQSPLHVAYLFDNHGTRLSGRLRQGMQFQHNNFLGRDDMLFNTTSISEHGDFVGESISYVFPLSPTSGLVTLSYSYNDVSLGKELRPLKVKGGGNVWGLGYMQPIAEHPNWSLDLNSGFDIKELWSTVDGQDNSRDHLRVFHFGPNLTLRDPWGSTYFNDSFSLGLSSFLGASVKVDSRSNKEGAGGQFFKDTLDFTRVQKLPFDSFLTAKFKAQLTKYRLLSSEEFAAGGFSSVRGYVEQDSLGDYGFFQSTQWHLPPYFIPKDFLVPGTKQTFLDAVQFVAFADLAKVYLRNAGTADASRFLIGVGAGMRISITNFASAQIDWGIPIGNTPQDGQETRLHFALTTYLPNPEILKHK